MGTVVLKMLRLCLLVLGFLLVEGVDIQGPTNTNTKLFTGNQALDSGTLGFGLGVGAAVLGSSLMGGAANSNPCGKRRRRSAQNSKDTRFFLGGGGTNCNYNTYPTNNYNTYPTNNYNTGCSSCNNNYNSGGGCRCTSLSWTDHYGNVNGN